MISPGANGGNPSPTLQMLMVACSGYQTVGSSISRTPCTQSHANPVTCTQTNVLKGGDRTRNGLFAVRPFRVGRAKNKKGNQNMYMNSSSRTLADTREELKEHPERWNPTTHRQMVSAIHRFAGFLETAPEDLTAEPPHTL